MRDAESRSRLSPFYTSPGGNWPASSQPNGPNSRAEHHDAGFFFIALVRKVTRQSVASCSLLTPHSLQ
jgi:hypothetical protein